MKYGNNSGSLGPAQNPQDMRGLTKTILPPNQNQSHYPNGQQKTFKITTKQGSSGQMMINTQSSNRNYNNTITLKNQRQTVVDSIAERNKQSLLGITRGQGQVNMQSNIGSQIINQSTLDQRQKMSPHLSGVKQGVSSGLSSIVKQAGNGNLADQERELKFPMDPRTAVINFSKYLMEIEKQEILDYDTIYWFNINDRKASKGPPTTPDGVDNNGFDNDKNEYITEEGQHISYRFEIVNRLGKGSFGQVFKCFDHKNQEYVALKILRNKKRLYKQGLIEAKILE